MRFIVRWVLRLVILAVVLIVALVLLKDILIEEFVESRLRTATGLEVRIDRLEARLFSPTLVLEGFRIYNPAEFGGSPFIEVDELHIQYDRAALTSGEIRLPLLRVDISEATIVRSTGGKWNLSVFAGILEQQLELLKEKGFEFHGVDTFNLSLGKVKRYDMNAPDQGDIVGVGFRGEVLGSVRGVDELAKALARLSRQRGLTQYGYPFGTGRPTGFE